MKKYFDVKKWLARAASVKGAAQAVSKKREPAPSPVKEDVVEGRECDPADIERLVLQVEEAQIDITNDYADWRNIGFALAHELREDGRDYFHRLSCFNSGYTQEGADKQYDACLNSTGSGITIGTLFYIAQQHGITLQPSLPPALSGVTQEEVLPVFSQSLADKLPPFIQDAAQIAKTDEEKTMIVLGALVAISACLGNTYGLYGGKRIYPNLFLYVVAPASSGKGRLALCKKIVEELHREKRKAYADAQEQYEKDKKKNPKTPEPTVSPFSSLIFPANTSAAAMHQMLHANNGEGLIFETEGDTLAISFKSDYGNYSDSFRKAFHHEQISFARIKDSTFIEIECPKLSVVLSGTPQQVRTLIPNAENGLQSRFLFYKMPLEVKWVSMFSKPGSKSDEDCFAQIGKRFTCFLKQYKLAYTVEFSLNSAQQGKFDTHFEKLQQNTVAVYDIGAISIIRRLGIIAYRMMMIFSALRVQGKCYSCAIKCTDEDFNSVLEMIDVLVKHSLAEYKYLNQQSNQEQQSPGDSTSSKQHLFESLPAKFTTEEAKAKGEVLKIAKKTTEKYLTEWTKNKLLKRESTGNYSKLTQ